MKKHNGQLDCVREALLIVLAVAWLAPTGPAHAQEPDAPTQAKAHYELGMTAYGLGHYDRAVQAFLRAYQVDPAPILLYNVAQAYWKKGQNEAAILFYRRYLDADPGAKNRTRIRARIRELQSGKKAAPPTEIAAAVVPPVAPSPSPSTDLVGAPDDANDVEAEEVETPVRGPITAPIAATAGTRERVVAVPVEAPMAEALREPAAPSDATAESVPGEPGREATELAATAGTRERVAAPAEQTADPQERGVPAAAEPTREAEPRQSGRIAADLGTSAVRPEHGPLSDEPTSDPAGGRPLSPDLFTVVEPSRPPIYQRPWFWPAVGAVSLATVAVILLVRPDQRPWSCGLECMGTREIP